MTPEGAGPPRDNPARILLVGNDLSLSEAERCALDEAGYEVMTASGFESAARVLGARPLEADIGLLDADLYGGASALSSLRAVPGAKTLPVLLLSSGAAPGLAEMAMNEGVYGVVAKGAGTALLLASLGAAFKVLAAGKKHVETEERLALAIEGSGAGLWDWMVETGQLTVNDRWAGMLGYKVEEITDGHETFVSLMHPEDAVKSDAITEKYRAGEIQSHEIEIRMRHKDGRWIWVLDRGKATERGPDGRLRRMSGIHFDITARKAVEEELKLLVRQKEELMKELQHRVKNSLNLVSSLLKLGLDELSEDRSKKVIRDSVARIHSMSAIYERLYRSSDLRSVDLRPYFEELSYSIFDVFGSGREGLSLAFESVDLRIDAERASTLGLILNELLTNALKYAYPEGSGGPIRVSLEREGDEARLTVADEGSGFSEGIDPLKTQSLGLTLVRMLAEQIGAELRIESRRGVRASAAFRP